MGPASSVAVSDVADQRQCRSDRPISIMIPTSCRLFRVRPDIIGVLDEMRCWSHEMHARVVAVRSEFGARCSRGSLWGQRISGGWKGKVALQHDHTGKLILAPSKPRWNLYVEESCAGGHVEKCLLTGNGCRYHVTNSTTFCASWTGARTDKPRLQMNLCFCLAIYVHLASKSLGCV
jgi:hypothetical protein